MSVAARRAGRDLASLRLIVVSKTFDAGAIEPLLLASQRDYGENRVQEAQGKWPVLKARFPHVRLHLIGPLQTNKVRDAVALFDVIHSVDRDKVAAALGREMARQGRALPVRVQVNTGEEPQKAGIAPHEAADFVRRCRDDFGLSVDGLMCIPPAEDNPAPHFTLLRELAGSLGLRALSMGMSGDFEAAIEHGATEIRVGSAIFGSRA
jgi:pyridoxal phosphate enzyme (YggS family)